MMMVDELSTIIWQGCHCLLLSSCHLECRWKLSPQAQSQHLMDFFHIQTKLCSLLPMSLWGAGRSAVQALQHVRLAKQRRGCSQTDLISGRQVQALSGLGQMDGSEMSDTNHFEPEGRQYHCWPPPHPLQHVGPGGWSKPLPCIIEP